MAHNADVVAFVQKHAKLSDQFEAHFEDPDVWSSFERIETALTAEETFNIQFSPEELTALTTPKSFVEMIESKLQ
ncbi:acyl carrier protein [Acetobacter peroxydans]|uniref:Carrier domain-containing protein n=1 Tax=Acetobacter peroxydans TaxID=104098 RepID=A0A4Y3TTY8_9PROT|nr:acyl carrier protein [Acetobacter peroxydans]NHO16519.1 hypothetical protein [Acetobacter peroxydans]GBR33022.1 hypothetical protein AA13755_0384 [Acetobacter peroxydans NBRC 13755]GBR42757.1 hypothetical protein AA0475_1601 [Acetobacter peroxydans]GEB85223.1 hypothetical protein APE01nite_10200 [Acetobacter peroxydans]